MWRAGLGQGEQQAFTDEAARYDLPTRHFQIGDMRQPGVAVRPLVDMTWCAPFNEVYLDDARVPVHEVIGEVNGGWRARRLGTAGDPVVRDRLASSRTRS